MIAALKSFPSYVAGFLCRGRVTRREYEETLIPAVEDALHAHHKICLYYETTADFALDAGAVWEDFRFGLQHLNRWDRIAVVTDVDWLQNATRAFSFLFPGRVRVFRASEAEVARSWLAAGP